ncbi:MAG: hypothetical protein Q6373_021990 [Candidatus Sigynarchaeota archaeon]
MTKHPGKIAYYESRDGVETLVKVEDVKSVPETIRFRKDKDGKDVPVVKVVAMKDIDGNVREIVEYGPDGEFLQSTMVAPPPPRPEKPQPRPKHSEE